MFDYTIDLGTLLQIGAILGGGIVFMFRMEKKISLLATEKDLQHLANTGRFDIIDQELKKLTDVVVELARQQEQINFILGRLDKLEDSPKPTTIAKRRRKN